MVPLRSILSFLLLIAGPTLWGEAVRNGNDLAREYARADEAGRKSLKAQYEGKLLTFRFLKVFRIEPPSTNAPPATLPILYTIEPSSDLKVMVHPQGAISREVLTTLTTNDAIAVSGRLLALDPPEHPLHLILKPAVVRHKDRLAPKGEKELLPEIDPRAVR